LVILFNDNLIYKKVAQEIDSSYFLSEKYKEIYELVSEHLEGMGHIPSLLEKIEDENLKNIIAELIISEPTKSPVDEIIKSLKLRKYKNDLEQINEQILTSPKDMELFSRKNELKKKILELDKKVVRKTLY